MARGLFCAWLLLVAFVAACRPTAGPIDLPPPRSAEKGELGAGDLIEIRVADQEELTGEFQVEADGTIRFPWIGSVVIRGRTQGQIAEEIETRLRDGWLRDPQVGVRITERQNREVSVLGQVNTPGSYPYKERLTLVQAISLAGGMNPLAQSRRVKLIRETDAGRETFEVDVTAIIERGAEDLTLEPGDVVFVPESPI